MGASTDRAWAQVHTFLPIQSEKLEKRGQLLAVFSLRKTGEGSEIAAFGREVITRFHEEYFGRLGGSIHRCLRQAVAKVAAEAAGGFEIEIVAAVLGSGAVFLVAFGPGKVFLKRNGSLAVICSGKRGKIVSSSGYPQKGDFFFLTNRRLGENLAEGTLQAVLGGCLVRESAEILAPFAYQKRGLSTPAGVVAEIRSAERIIEEEKKQKRKKSRLLKIKPALKKPLFFKSAAANKRRKSEVAFGVVFASALLLAASLIRGGLKKAGFWQPSEDSVISQQIQVKINDAQSLIDLNPTRSKQLFLEAEQMLDDLTDRRAAEIIPEFRQVILTGLRLISGEHVLDRLPLFFDLEIIKENGRGESLALGGESLLVLDIGSQVIYQLEISDRKGEILAGGEILEGAVGLTVSLQEIFVLTARGVVQMGIRDDGVVQIIEADSNWQEPVSLNFFGDNLYLWDRGRLDLYRYPAVESGFGPRQFWLREKRENLKGVVSVAIDGAVWFLKEDGEVLKFTRGTAEDFSVVGLEEPFASPRKIFTGPDLERLYILDSENRRVVILGKDGRYESQYKWSEERIEDLVVSEERGKIWLLGENKIYEMELE